MQSHNQFGIANNMGNSRLGFTFYAKFLPFVFSIGLFTLFLVAYLSIKGLKDDFDGSVPEPLSELSLLNDFQSQYMLETIDILQDNPKGTKTYATSFYQWSLYKNLSQSLNEQRGVFSFLRHIYKTTFLTKQNDMILSLERKKQQLVEEVEKTITLEAANILKADRDLLYEHAKKVNSISANIITTQVALHTLEKEITDHFHNATIGLLCMITLLVFIIVVCIDIVVIGFIRRLNQYLEEQFNNATADLRKLNAHLQNEIAKKVEDIRKKDIAIYAQSKLAAMGEMVQNIAHQWRNPLNSLGLVMQDIQQKFNRNSLTKEILNKHITTSLALADNMSNTIDIFHNFFRLDNSFEHFDIKDAIHEVVIIYEPLLQALNIQIHIEYDTQEEYRIFGNKHAFMQIVLVLLGNIKDVFAERKIKNPYCFITLGKKDSTLRLDIYDNAGGINPHIIDRIFDIYVTTKKMGTGIGLYMAKEMLTKYLQGNIHAKNITFNYNGEYCKGALFVLELQLSDTMEGEVGNEREIKRD